MSERMLTVEDAAACLADLVERIRASRETAVLLRGGQPVARIVPMLAPGQVAEDLLLFLRRWRVEHPDPDEQLGLDIGESRKGVKPPHDPWE